MKKIILRTLFVLLTLALVIPTIIFANPLRRPSSWIRHSVLNLTPIGTSMEDAIETIEAVEEKGKWEIDYIDDEYGYTSEKGYRVGEKSIDVIAGEYALHPLAKTIVVICWGFDRDGNLVDVYVKKEVDTL